MGSRGKSGQVSGFGLGAHSPSAGCCPIEPEGLVEIEAAPEDAADQGEEAGEAVRPANGPLLETQQDVEQQGCPELPADGVLGVAQKVADFEGLLELLEEDFDRPARGVRCGAAFADTAPGFGALSA